MRRNGYKPEHRRESELCAGICNGIGIKANNKRGKAERNKYAVYNPVKRLIEVAVAPDEKKQKQKQ